MAWMEKLGPQSLIRRLLRFSNFRGLVQRHQGTYPSLTMQLCSAKLTQVNPQRRAAVRYKLRLPVIFHWNDGGDQTEGGFTCDVALDGVFIRSKRFPPAGSEVQIEVLIPSPYECDEVRIHCIGKVTRVVKQGAFSGFGVVGDFDDDDLTQQALSNPRE